MNFSSVEKIADAVLFEGFMLYPYRPTATKNRQRWNFGTLYPLQYAEAQRPVESCRFITECLVEAAPNATLNVRIRFVQLAPLAVDSRTSEGWQQGLERSADICRQSIAELIAGPRVLSPKFELVQKSAPQQSEKLPFEVQIEFAAQLAISASAIENGVYKLRIELKNSTPCLASTRNVALLRSFISAHAILGIEGGRFLSLLDPPEHLRQAAATCQNEGVFPVLAGDEASHAMMLCSPIILYDFPQTAPESAGDFFDGTEMDEMLALRVMTLTEEEKQEMRGGDDRTRMVLERTEALPQEHLMKLHGAIRGLRPVQEEKA